MKIKRLKINHWRHFEGVEITVPDNATLVALIGENGVGKSSILDIVNSAAHHLGLAAGIDIPRGDPFSDTHDLSMEVFLGHDAHGLLAPDVVNTYKELGLEFDGRLSFISVKNPEKDNKLVFLTSYGKIPNSVQFAKVLIEALRQKSDTFHLSLDADRSYPPRPVQAHEYGQSLEQDWESTGWKKHRAFISSRNKYEEWMRYCVGTEAKNATEAYQAQRLALVKGIPAPEFIDSFKSYGDSVRRVLPHLQFLGVDTKAKTLIFDSTGDSLIFDKLSGGEREIAFVVGQIERFSLAKGLLLIDEPELHLNPEMVRTWVAYLRDTVSEGQTWIATHSMEAVEAAGLECTFVIQRNVDTKKISSVASLVDQPVLSVLSAAIGSPAFSLTKKSFVFIEGDRQGVERDKYYRIVGLTSDTGEMRFMEGGGCSEVSRKLEACRFLSIEADQQIHVGAIIDRDFRSAAEISNYCGQGVFVLPFHEIENAFLFPPVLDRIAASTGIAISGAEIIQKISDRLSGKWILSKAIAISNTTPKNYRGVMAIAASHQWHQIDTDANQFLVALNIECETATAQESLTSGLASAIDAYRLIRLRTDLWTECEGKQVLSALPAELGYSKQTPLINNICTLYRQDTTLIPEEFQKIATYIGAL
ncbi:MAG TPA: AAA family ATPase [Azonexus sp.]|nr:AAA family ATPase [Azonexus sp.]